MNTRSETFGKALGFKNPWSEVEIEWLTNFPIHFLKLLFTIIHSKNIQLWAQEALVQLWSASITFKDYFGYILSDREFFASLW